MPSIVIIFVLLSYPIQCPQSLKIENFAQLTDAFPRQAGRECACLFLVCSLTLSSIPRSRIIETASYLLYGTRISTSVRAELSFSSTALRSFSMPVPHSALTLSLFSLSAGRSQEAIASALLKNDYARNIRCMEGFENAVNKRASAFRDEDRKYQPPEGSDRSLKLLPMLI